MTHASRRFQAIIWDMDGVLVDSGEFHYQAWAETYRMLTDGRQELSRAEFARTFGLRNPEVVAYLFGPALLAPDFVRSVSEAKEALFREKIRGQAKPLPGVHLWLAHWREAGAKQALASSAPWPNIDALLAELDARPCFDAIVSGEDVAQGKPAPDIFLEAARRLTVDPERCLVIEDAVPGVQAARAAGMRCLAVTTSNSRQALAAADWVVAQLDELSPDELAA